MDCTSSIWSSCSGVKNITSLHKGTTPERFAPTCQQLLFCNFVLMYCNHCFYPQHQPSLNHSTHFTDKNLSTSLKKPTSLATISSIKLKDINAYGLCIACHLQISFRLSKCGLNCQEGLFSTACHQRP